MHPSLFQVLGFASAMVQAACYFIAAAYLWVASRNFKRRSEGPPATPAQWAAA